MSGFYHIRDGCGDDVILAYLCGPDDAQGVELDGDAPFEQADHIGEVVGHVIGMAEYDAGQVGALFFDNIQDRALLVLAGW